MISQMKSFRRPPERPPERHRDVPNVSIKNERADVELNAQDIEIGLGSGPRVAHFPTRGRSKPWGVLRGRGKLTDHQKIISRESRSTCENFESDHMDKITFVNIKHMSTRLCRQMSIRGAPDTDPVGTAQSVRDPSCTTSDLEMINDYLDCHGIGVG